MNHVRGLIGVKSPTVIRALSIKVGGDTASRTRDGRQLSSRLSKVPPGVTCGTSLRGGTGRLRRLGIASFHVNMNRHNSLDFRLGLVRILKPCVVCADLMLQLYSWPCDEGHEKPPRGMEKGWCSTVSQDRPLAFGFQRLASGPRRFARTRRGALTSYCLLFSYGLR